LNGPCRNAANGIDALGVDDRVTGERVEPRFERLDAVGRDLATVRVCGHLLDEGRLQR
jgi:hypothetical protein